MNALEEAKSLKSYMLGLRNHFHSHPELALQEFKTADKIEDELLQSGIKSFRVDRTNVIAEIDSGKKGRTLLLRADIDALPIQEKNDVPYKSQNDGVMHACGHDGHTAYLLGVARLLKKHLSDFSGKVILVFQSGEESGLGARTVIDAGVVDNVDRIFGIHFQSGLDVGKIAIKSGEDMASCDRFKIEVHGKSSHITKPHEGVDALFIASLIVVKLQTLVSRLISPVENALIGVGRINSGTTYNVLSGQAEIEGTIRAFSSETRKKLWEKVTLLAQNTALEYGGKADVSIVDICDPLINQAVYAKEAVEAAKKVVGEENVLTQIDKRFSSDNFADFMRKAPGTYIHVGSSDSERTRYSHHNEHFDLAEDSCVYAAATVLQYTLDYLKD